MSEEATILSSYQNNSYTKTQTDAMFASVWSSVWAISGGVTSRQLSVKTVTGAYTVLSSDQLVIFNGTDLTGTMIDAGLVADYKFNIKNIDSTVLVLSGYHAQTIDGDNTVILTQYDAIQVVSNGSNWFII